MIEKSALLAATVAGLAGFTTLTGSAHAQAPLPQGHWKSAAGEAYLLVSPPICSMESYALGFTVAGGCGWQPTNVGAILTIVRSGLGIGNVSWSVIWINRTNITLDGERYFLLQ